MIKNEDQNVFEWLDNIPPHMWSRQAFDPQVKSDHIIVNMTKSFTQWVGPLKGKLVLTLIESLVIRMMGKIHSRCN